MATVNYSWNLPTVGGDEDAWGGLLNANWTALDTLLGGTNATEFAILDGATVTTVELNYLSGATSAIQSQLNLKVDETSATGSAVIPSGTTAQRDVSPVDGYFRYNSTTEQFEGYAAGAWGAIGSDLSSVAADIVPDADSTRDLGSSTIAWALAYLDAIEPVGADTTIKRVGGTGTTAIVEGLAKAWVNFNGTGTPTARDSFNLSSITDNGTGDYTLNWTSAFSAATYVAAGQMSSNSASSSALGGLPTYRDSSDVIVVPATTGWRSRWSDGVGNYFDGDVIMSSAHGDIA